jgi:hypothetical protein
MPIRCCKRPQLVPQLEPDLVVEVRHRLVEQPERWIDGQRPAERHALPLAAGELRDGPRAVAFELQQLQHFLRRASRSPPSSSRAS